jgi:hypothetical protein
MISLEHRANPNNKLRIVPMEEDEPTIVIFDYRSGLRHFPLNYYKSSLRRFVARGTKTLDGQVKWTWWFLWFELPERNTLRAQRGLLYCCVWCCSSLELNLVAPVVCSSFYSLRSGSYTVTQGPIGGPRIVESLYNS